MNEASASDTASLLQGLVVEDLPASAVWLCDVLEEVFPDMVVRQADCVESGRKTIDAAVPQLALIDLGLPDGSGIELIRKLAHGGQTPHIQRGCHTQHISAKVLHLGLPPLRQ